MSVKVAEMEGDLLSTISMFGHMRSVAVPEQVWVDVQRLAVDLDLAGSLAADRVHRLGAHRLGTRAGLGLDREPGGSAFELLTQFDQHLSADVEGPRLTTLATAYGVVVSFAQFELDVLDSE